MPIKMIKYLLEIYFCLKIYKIMIAKYQIRMPEQCGSEMYFLNLLLLRQ